MKEQRKEGWGKEKEGERKREREGGRKERKREGRREEKRKGGILDETWSLFVLYGFILLTMTSSLLAFLSSQRHLLDKTFLSCVSHFPQISQPDNFWDYVIFNTVPQRSLTVVQSYQCRSYCTSENNLSDSGHPKFLRVPRCSPVMS